MHHSWFLLHDFNRDEWSTEHKKRNVIFGDFMKLDQEIFKFHYNQTRIMNTAPEDFMYIYDSILLNSS